MPRPLLTCVLVALAAMTTLSCGAGMEESSAQREAERFDTYAEGDVIEETETQEESLEEKLEEAMSDAQCASEIRDDAFLRGQQLEIEVIRLENEMMEVDTAAAFLRMRQAARSEGVELPLNSGFRTMAEQERLYQCYQTGSCNNGNLAARPGHSRHQSGRAVDISTGNGAVEWLDEHAGSFGFYNPIRGREPWHWEYEPERDLLLGEIDHCEALAREKMAVEKLALNDHAHDDHDKAPAL